MNRIRQVSHYAWLQSKDMAKAENKGTSYRLNIYYDMMRCFLKYRMWTNQYVKENFHKRTAEEREAIGAKCLESGKKRDAWQKDFRENREFLIKYTNIKYERASLREKRNKAYTERFHAGKNLFVEYDVNISRQHYLDGKITIGDNVLLAKHTFIDYSGELIIHDNATMANGVIIETHTHIGKDAVQTRLEIGDGVNILSRAYISDTCHVIGRRAQIGAGTYVRTNVPPYAIMIGNPGKIIGFRMSPEEIVEYEKQRYPIEERLSEEELQKNYEKYFLNRWKEIKVFTRI